MYYLDTSFVGPIFVEEATSLLVENWLRQNEAAPLYVSDWLGVELAGSLARRVRMQSLTKDQADASFTAFANWQDDRCINLTPDAMDFDFAAAAIRRYDSGLRAGDALHLAIARNNGNLTVLSFDQGMIRAAILLGIAVQTV